MSAQASPRYELDVEKAARTIEAYNGSPCAQAGEHLLDVAFSDFRTALSPTRVHKLSNPMKGCLQEPIFCG